MAQFVRHGGDIIRSALVVEQNPGSQVRGEGGAESAAHLAFADLAVNVVGIQDLLGHAGELGMELVEGLQDDLRGLVIAVGLIRLGDRGVDVIAAELFHTEALGLELEEALEVLGVLAGDIEQGLDH